MRIRWGGAKMGLPRNIVERAALLRRVPLLMTFTMVVWLLLGIGLLERIVGLVIARRGRLWPRKICRCGWLSVSSRPCGATKRACSIGFGRASRRICHRYIQGTLLLFCLFLILLSQAIHKGAHSFVLCKTTGMWWLLCVNNFDLEISANFHPCVPHAEEEAPKGVEWNSEYKNKEIEDCRCSKHTVARRFLSLTRVSQLSVEHYSLVEGGAIINCNLWPFWNVLINVLEFITPFPLFQHNFFICMYNAVHKFPTLPRAHPRKTHFLGSCTPNKRYQKSPTSAKGVIEKQWRFVDLL